MSEFLTKIRKEHPIKEKRKSGMEIFFFLFRRGISNKILRVFVLSCNCKLGCYQRRRRNKKIGECSFEYEICKDISCWLSSLSFVFFFGSCICYDLSDHWSSLGRHQSGSEKDAFIYELRIIVGERERERGREKNCLNLLKSLKN